MPYPVIPDVPGNTQSDPTTPSQRVNVKAANTPPTLADGPEVTVLSPANTGLPVNTPTIVQKAAGKSTGSVASLAQAFANNNVAGNSIIVVCGIGNGTDPTITDSNNNTYTKANTGANSTTFEASIWFAVNIAGGPNTVTVTPSASVSVAMEIYEVSGILAQITAQPDQSATNSGSSTTASTANVTPVISNTLFFSGVAVGTAAQTITPASGWTNDSGQQNVGGTPSGLFSFVSMSQYRAGIGTISPSATLAGSEPWAMAVASFRGVALPVEGKVSVTSPYPFGAIPKNATSGDVAAATAAATLPAATGKTTYITGFTFTSTGSTGAATVDITVTDGTWTITYVYASVAGATLANPILDIRFPFPLPASAANTTIVASAPTLGSGNLHACTNAYGFQL